MSFSATMSCLVLQLLHHCYWMNKVIVMKEISAIVYCWHPSGPNYSHSSWTQESVVTLMVSTATSSFVEVNAETFCFTTEPVDISGWILGEGGDREAVRPHQSHVKLVQSEDDSAIGNNASLMFIATIKKALTSRRRLLSSDIDYGALCNCWSTVALAVTDKAHYWPVKNDCITDVRYSSTLFHRHVDMCRDMRRNYMYIWVTGGF